MVLIYIIPLIGLVGVRLKWGKLKRLTIDQPQMTKAKFKLASTPPNLELDGNRLKVRMSSLIVATALSTIVIMSWLLNITEKEQSFAPLALIAGVCLCYFFLYFYLRKIHDGENHGYSATFQANTLTIKDDAGLIANIKYSEIAAFQQLPSGMTLFLNERQIVIGCIPTGYIDMVTQKWITAHFKKLIEQKTNFPIAS